MASPVIAVTGAVASGKTTVATVVAARGGALVDCDALAHRALALDVVKRRLTASFGRSILTRAGNVSRARLRAIVFSSEERMATLNAIVRPHVTRTIDTEVRNLRGAFPYIVLDAVLFFHYTFKFKVDLIIVTEAAERVRLGRLMRRNGLPRDEALERIQCQRYLERDWMRADCTIRTDIARRAVVRIAESIRDGFLATHGIGGLDDE
jgi:dephospho-CoA kinase